MRAIVPHTRTIAEVKASVDQGFERIFAGLPLDAVKLTDQQRAWSGDTLNFSFSANPGFMKIPISGSVRVEERQVVIDLDLPSFLSHFIAEDKIKTAVETQVRGLLT